MTPPERGPKQTVVDDLCSGVAITAAGGTGLWYFLPRHGKVHPLARQPFIETVIPVAIVSALGAGVALIVSGVAGIF